MRIFLPFPRVPLFARPLNLILFFCIMPTLTASSSAQVKPSALREMREIFAFKASFTPAEQKMSTNLVLASRAAAGKPLGSMARFFTPLQTDTQGRLLLDVAGFASASLVQSDAATFEDIAGQKPAANFQQAHLRAHVQARNLARFAAHPDVSSLREVVGHSTNVGSITSQGYVSEGANKVVSAGINGTGIKVGVLSDSASAARVAALIASGDLPVNTVVVPGQAGPTTGEDEGAAMMEIIHDIAPGAQLFFATGDTGQAAFAANIRTLRFTYGCDIIVDDFTYFAESVFQDGPLAQAVNSVTANGALYFSAAANNGNLDSASAGTWEGDFTSAGTYGLISTFEGLPVLLNNFGTTSSPQINDQLTSSPTSGVYLHWSDPNAGSFNDYDLFILNSTGTTIKGFGANAQTGTQDPFEFVQPSSTTVCASATPTGYCPAAGDQIVVALYSGSPRALHIDTERATLAIGTSGATFGHNAAANTFTMAATYWNAAHTGARIFTGGAADPVEIFSSDGPRKIFYNPDGTPITPGNYLFRTSGGITLQKPDATAADGVSTATPGFLPFFGTSAAAPHAAAVAALVKSANPALTNTQIRTILTNTALDNMVPGVDRDSGYGILMAPAAIAAAQALISH